MEVNYLKKKRYPIENDIKPSCLGDVDTSKKVKPTVEDGVSTIQGLSGRKLILDNSWNNPSGEYRVGVKRAYELFPTELKNRVKSVSTLFHYSTSLSLFSHIILLGTSSKLCQEASSTFERSSVSSC